MAALLKLANLDDSRKERSSARGMDAAVTQHAFSTQLAISLVGEEVVVVAWLD